MKEDRAAPNEDRPFLEISPREQARLCSLSEEFPAGVSLSLTDGEYSLPSTAVLPSNTDVRGAGRDRTRIVLEEGSDCHVFQNSDQSEGNVNISLTGMTIDGACSEQDRVDDKMPPICFCGIYMRRVAGLWIKDCSLTYIRQTAAHFEDCREVQLEEFRSRRPGWSGVSIKSSSDIRIEAFVEDAGWDGMHPAIHVDGCVGVYVDAIVAGATGSGIVLSSASADSVNCVVKGSVSQCLHGASLNGSAANDLRNVYIEGVFAFNTEAGICISDARNVIVASSLVQGNGTTGIRFEGQIGAQDCLVVDTIVTENPVAYEQLYSSVGNWIFELPGASDPSAEAVRHKPRFERSVEPLEISNL